MKERGGGNGRGQKTGEVGRGRRGESAISELTYPQKRGRKKEVQNLGRSPLKRETRAGTGQTGYKSPSGGKRSLEREKKEKLRRGNFQKVVKAYLECLFPRPVIRSWED